MEEQSSREFASADTSAGAQDAAVQEPRLRAEILVNPRGRLQHLQTSNVILLQLKRTARFALWRWTRGGPPSQQPENS
jgi:hypothetical protein